MSYVTVKLREVLRHNGDVDVEEMTAADWPAVAAVYAEGLATSDASFESRVPDWPQWDTSHLPSPRIVARAGGRVVGWAALAPFSRRHAYRGVAEVSVYVATSERGRGVGRRLLDALVARAEEEQLWTLQAGVFPENEASLALHRACGFRVVGVRERLGERNGVWRDVVLLERLSQSVA